MDYTNINKIDSEAADIIKKEKDRQLNSINLIASENYISPAVQEALASEFSNKYSEGYPGARYYPGNEYIDEMELLAQERALKLFKVADSNWQVNVQPYSGSPANFAVYSAILEKDDIALGMSLPAGGHLTHGHKVSASGKFFNFIQYGLDEKGEINYGEVEKLAQEHKPKLIIAGTSAYSRTIDFEAFSAIAKKVNALLMVDMAHIAGLVAGDVHNSPFPYADIVTTTTHKTLRGPRGAMIFSNSKEISEKINKAIFPGLQGGPHNQRIVALAVALKEALSDDFKEYANQIIINARILSEELSKKDFNIVSGKTENHLFLIDLTNKNLSGGDAEKLLEKNSITANRNTVPNDKRGAINPSGIRIGTPAVTTRGMKEEEMKVIADFIERSLKGEEIVKEVKKLALKFPPPGY